MDASTPTIYGIPNCDSVKKARQWFAAQGHAVVFHDFKKQGLSADLLAQWLQHVDWQVVLNRKGTTWRQLSPAQREAVVDAATAQAAMLAQPSLVKRPVVFLPHPPRWVVGVNPSEWARVGTE